MRPLLGGLVATIVLAGAGQRSLAQLPPGVLALTTRFNVNQDLKTVPLKKALADLSVQTRVPLSVDLDGFARAGKKDVLETTVSVAAARNQPLSSVLQGLLVQVGGTHRIADNVIWIEAGKANEVQPDLPDTSFVAMHASTRYKLHFGPYRTPTFRVGQRLECQVRGMLGVAGMSAGRIAWPIGRGSGRARGCKSLIVRGGLAKAIRMESINAVAHWWGVTPQTVTKWRRRLGIRDQPVGTSKLRSAHFHEPWADATRRKAWSKARDPARREKIAAAKRGVRRSRATRFKMSEYMTGKKLSAETRRKMSAAHKSGGTRPPKAGKAWEAWEDELVQTLPGTEAAKQTGRTYSAVQNRRVALKVPDGRRRSERQQVGRS